MTRAAIILGAAALAVLYVMPAHAQAPQVPRVFVSGSGSDSNPCTFVQPCRTFQQAFNTAPADAEIDVLDPAGYGPLTITHAISIQGHGFASITQANATPPAAGVTISAGTSDAVLLNGLIVDGVGTAYDGVLINSAGSVQIVDCDVRHFGGNGIDYEANNAAVLSVSNTITSDNGGAGIYIVPQSGTPQITLDEVTATNNSHGAGIGNGGQVMVMRSNLSNNAARGLFNFGASGGQVMVKTSTLANNAIGVGAYKGTIWLSGNAIYGNGNGVNISGGTVNSFGDNDFAKNGTDVINGPMGTATAQ
jgi:hypothetical protein